MKTIKYYYLKFTLLVGMIFLGSVSCDKHDTVGLDLATLPTNGEVFIDGFSGGLNYYPFAGSKMNAFSVDTETKYKGTASMRFDVPNVGDPDGAYAGAIFPDATGRDLSGYDALTFWAKASQTGTINEIGFGNDFGENKYMVSMVNVVLSTNWKKIIIPLPVPAKLTAEKGMFWYAEGPENGNGYSFWIDELKYEKLGTIAHGQASIMNGNNVSRTTFVGVNATIDGVIATFSMPSGGNQSVLINPAYLSFTSSNPSVASVNSSGLVSSLSAGTATITASFNGAATTGSLTINCAGNFVHAPVPTRNQANVISIFSNAYTNVPVNYYNGYWQPWQTTVSNDFAVNNDNVLNYTIFNFVGIEFSTPTVNATPMTHFHLDAFIPGSIIPGRQLRVIVVDFGANGVFGGGDDTRHSTTFTAPFLVSQNWMSIDIPFSAMPGLLSRSHLGQIILEGGDGSVLYVDNIYFYN